MANEALDLSLPKKAAGNPYPRRGQIKAKIFGMIVKSVAALASSDGGSNRKRRGGGSDTSASITPVPSAYTSEGHSDA
ncbi:hypothetical protein H6P81_006207 [Aristolochia fimbriata]|uniref:Uncharacterized protein n=1 Tax=Aristolochia fimbriata TaxID=158543 RepID=A0AAV7F186_ARIFI|nr:hypothetical protein H6P81_006207 [Aristolochia fimbriata]